jgi:DNA-binding PadR family transcriptional regulator
MTRTAKGTYPAEFELLVLLALARLGRQAYGVTVRREIEERGGRPVSIGAVYATLGRLAEKALVESELSAPLAVRGGRSRRHYHLTAAGERVLARALSMLDRMAEGLDLARPAGEGAR